MSNRPFAEKQTELSKSNLVLNADFKKARQWNAKTIAERAEKLAAETAELWPRPEGGDYVPPVEDKPVKLTPAERRALRLDYWTNLLSLVEERGIPAKRPKPSKRGWIGFPIGIKGFRLLAFINFHKRYVGVALACRGTSGKANFALLQEHKSSIESAIGEKLLWQELPNQQSSRIALRRAGVSPTKSDDWTQQHAWIADQLEIFQKVLNPICQEIVPSAAESGSQQELCRSFWTGLLDRAAAKTDLHSEISPGFHQWIGTGAGLSGLAYNYVIKSDARSVELYIDFGKGKKAKNEQLFDKLHQQKDQIEDAFGGSLDWERLNSKRACRIACRFNMGGYRSHESDWPNLQNEMIDAMIRLENALSPQIEIVKADLQPE